MLIIAGILFGILSIYIIGWVIIFIALMMESDRKFGGPWNWDMAPMWAAVALAWPYIAYIFLVRSKS